MDLVQPIRLTHELTSRWHIQYGVSMVQDAHERHPNLGTRWGTLGVSGSFARTHTGVHPDTGAVAMLLYPQLDLSIYPPLPNSVEIYADTYSVYNSNTRVRSRFWSWFGVERLL
jgi:hypothetical protein